MNTKIVLAIKESPNFVKELTTYANNMKIPNASLIMTHDNIINISKFFDLIFNIKICFGENKICALKGNIEVISTSRITIESFDDFISNLIRYCNKPF